MKTLHICIHMCDFHSSWLVTCFRDHVPVTNVAFYPQVNSTHAWYVWSPDTARQKCWRDNGW